MNTITLQIERQNYTFRYIPAPRGNKYRLVKYPDENAEEAVGDVHAFYMADTPIRDGKYPKGMSWNDGIALCKNLTGYDKKFNSYSQYKEAVENNELFLRLPTEYEWEWAALGGEDFEYAGCTNVDKVAWHDRNSKDVKHEVKREHEVKQKKPNGYGLYDMSGNIREGTANWCDRDGPPKHQNTGSDRVFRGGGCYYPPSFAQVAIFYGLPPGYRTSDLGVRLCFSANSDTLEKLSKSRLMR